MSSNGPRTLGLWQRVYAAAHRRRRERWRTRAERLPRPVISVGNLHWGGAGKTPTTAAIAAHLRDRGLAVAILSRGYGSHGRGVRLASRGAGGLLPPREIGDEPAELAAQLPGVALVVAPERAAAGRAALAQLSPPPDVFLLDDGFSHLALARDLDLLVFPSADPLGGGLLWPGGRLREPLAAAAHAHVALLTGREADASRTAELARALASHGFSGPVFAAPTRALPAALLADDAGNLVTRSAALPPGSAVLLVSAIARPRELAATVAAGGHRVVDHLAFRDHFAYPESACRVIPRRFAKSGASVVLTTAKDAVKLAHRLPVPLAIQPIHIEPEAAFWVWLDAWLDRTLAPS